MLYVMTTTHYASNASDAGEEAPAPTPTESINSADGVVWIRIPIGEKTEVWPAHAVSEFNDWEAAY